MDAQADGSRIGRIRLLLVANASQAVLTPAVRGIVEPDFHVLTDDWNG